jgi:hypothetical protein
MTLVKDLCGRVMQKSPVISTEKSSHFKRAKISLYCVSKKDFLEVCDNLRFFYVRGIEVRAFPSNDEFTKLKKGPAKKGEIELDNLSLLMPHSRLYNIFKKFGPVQNLEIKRGPDYESLG